MYIRCPECHSKTKRMESKFCPYCKCDFAENHCSNRECSVFKESEILKNDERYCYHCGEKTTFFEENKIPEFKALASFSAEIDESIPF